MVIWYLRRPVVWGELIRGGARRMRGPVPDERPAASARCAELAVPREQAAEALGFELVDVTELEEYQRARKLLAERGVHVAGAGDTAMLYSACLGTRPGSVLETGVAHGLSSLAILLALSSNGSGCLTSIDMPYRGSSDDAYVGQAVPQDLRSGWTLLRVPDRRGLSRATKSGPFDVVHYDSDKTRAGREFAYPRLWSMLRSGGVFLSDDVGDDLAFVEFAASVGVTPTIWRKADGGDFVGGFSKP